MFSKEMKNKLIIYIKQGDKLLNTDTLNRMYDLTLEQNEFNTLTSIAIKALNDVGIKTDEDICEIKKTKKLKAYLNEIVRKWMEER